MQFSHVSRALFVLFLFFQLPLLAQQKQAFGKLTKAEKDLEVYENEPSSNAVVLYERGDNYFEVIDHRIWLVKEYHTKIKVFNEKGFDHGTIAIPLKKNGTSVREN